MQITNRDAIAALEETALDEWQAGRYGAAKELEEAAFQIASNMDDEDDTFDEADEAERIGENAMKAIYAAFEGSEVK